MCWSMRQTSICYKAQLSSRKDKATFPRKPPLGSVVPFAREETMGANCHWVARLPINEIFRHFEETADGKSQHTTNTKKKANGGFSGGCFCALLLVRSPDEHFGKSSFKKAYNLRKKFCKGREAGKLVFIPLLFFYKSSKKHITNNDMQNRFD